MKCIETAGRASRWHTQWAVLTLASALVACASAGPWVPVDTPSEAARHRAALAVVVVLNMTEDSLAIAFQSATPPLQEVTIGRVVPAARARMAPVPAGEPIILIARRGDGSELKLAARTFVPDTEWLWEIPRDATFTRPERAN